MAALLKYNVDAAISLRLADLGRLFGGEGLGFIADCTDKQICSKLVCLAFIFLLYKSYSVYDNAV